MGELQAISQIVPFKISPAIICMQDKININFSLSKICAIQYILDNYIMIIFISVCRDCDKQHDLL